MSTLFPKRNLCESQHTIGPSQIGHHALQPVVGEHKHHTQCAKRKRRGQSEMNSATARWNLTNSSEHVTHIHVLPGNSCRVINFVQFLISPLGAKYHSESIPENFHVISCTNRIEVMNNIFLSDMNQTMYTYQQEAPTLFLKSIYDNYCRLLPIWLYYSMNIILTTSAFPNFL